MKIALLDDKSYGIKQVKQIHIDDEYEFFYFDTFISFQENKDFFDIVYLDYYLLKDGLTGGDVLDDVKKRSKRVVGFSSLKEKSELLVLLGADEAITKGQVATCPYEYHSCNSP